MEWITKMKTTKYKLRRMIRKVLIEQHKVGGDMPRDMWSKGQAPLEITDVNITEEQIREFWPNVVYNGADVMDLMYDETIISRAEDALLDITGEDRFEGQEAYLGYDRQNDVFVMGFDVWLDSGMEAGIVELGSRGDVLDVNMGGKGMYPDGVKQIKQMWPGIIDLRLD